MDSDTLHKSRKEDLSAALTKEGLKFRDDSVFCQQYVLLGPAGQFRGFCLNIPVVVTQLSQAKWFHEYTYYRLLLSEYRKDGYDWSHACRSAKKRILYEHRGYPKVWPWKLPASDTQSLESQGLHILTPYTRLWAQTYHARSVVEHWLWYHLDDLSHFLRDASGGLSDIIPWSLAIMQSVIRYRHVTFMVSNVANRTLTDDARASIDEILLNIQSTQQRGAHPKHITCHKIINEHGCCVGMCIKR